MTYEPTEAEKEQMTEQLRRYREVVTRRSESRRRLREARRKGIVPPPHTPYRFFLPRTTAHFILSRLGEKGPATRQELTEELLQSETSINSQILRLLDYGLVDRDRFAVYSITDNGEEALQQLDAGISHTRWFR